MKQISFLLFTLLLLLTSVLSYSQSLCNAITKKNTRCRNKVTTTTTLCFTHQYKVDNQSNPSKQCMGITQTNARCKRRTKTGNYCYAHTK